MVVHSLTQADSQTLSIESVQYKWFDSRIGPQKRARSNPSQSLPRTSHNNLQDMRDIVRHEDWSRAPEDVWGCSASRMRRLTSVCVAGQRRACRLLHARRKHTLDVRSYVSRVHFTTCILISAEHASHMCAQNKLRGFTLHSCHPHLLNIVWHHWCFFVCGFWVCVWLFRQLLIHLF